MSQIEPPHRPRYDGLEPTESNARWIFHDLDRRVANLEQPPTTGPESFASLWERPDLRTAFLVVLLAVATGWVKLEVLLPYALHRFGLGPLPGG